jgi:4-hydroxy-tetrahydrodipicolinate reductase
MKIALLGYGRMGKAIADIAKERGHEIVAIVDPDTQEGTLTQAQVAINFSVPDAAVANIKSALKMGVPVVCGTTGWLGQRAEVEAYCQTQNSAFLYASNFSIGVNLFFSLNQKLAQLMQPHPDYIAKMEEIHHIHKLDAPSGTAITLAEGVIENSPYQKWVLEGNQESNRQLPIHSIREGELPGTHSVHFQGANDLISIRHEAFNRKGFALGAIVAAEWIVGKKGVFGMNDVLNLSEEGKEI